VSKQDGLVFTLAGLLAFVACTAYYAAFGDGLLERAFWFYAVNAFLAAGATGFLYYAAVRIQHTPRRRRPLAALVFAAPGLVGGALMMSQLTQLLPRFEPVSIGRYGAFLFVGYTLVAAMAFEKIRTAASPAR